MSQKRRAMETIAAKALAVQGIHGPKNPTFDNCRGKRDRRVPANFASAFLRHHLPRCRTGWTEPKFRSIHICNTKHG